MAGTFDGSGMFTSGPARFVDGWLGQGFDYPRSGNNSTGFFATSGVLARGVTQTGRLVATTSSALQAFIDTIKATAEAETTGDLVSPDGRSWEDITMLRIRFDDRVDRGRVFSVGYTIDYGEVV